MSAGAPAKVTPRPRPARLSEALGAKLDPRVRAFADHLAKAVAESVLRDIRGGGWDTLLPEQGQERAGHSSRKPTGRGARPTSRGDSSCRQKTMREPRRRHLARSSAEPVRYPGGGVDRRVNCSGEAQDRGGSR